jgi:hypothetical protein
MGGGGCDGVLTVPLYSSQPRGELKCPNFFQLTTWNLGGKNSNYSIIVHSQFVPSKKEEKKRLRTHHIFNGDSARRLHYNGECPLCIEYCTV